MADLPSKQALLDWIAEHPDESATRDLARAFGIRGKERVALRALLREMKDDGSIPRRRPARPVRNGLPPVGVIEITALDADGDLVARLPARDGRDEARVVRLVADRAAGQLAPGDRVLAHLRESAGRIEAKAIRRIGHGPRRVLGILRHGPQGARIEPVDKGASGAWLVPDGATLGAKDGELVEAGESGPPRRAGLPQARVLKRLGDPFAPRAFSLIAIHEHGIPDDFPEAVLAEAEAATPASATGREDLRDLPLVTIDPADARDRDDAVCAMPDDDPRNEGGHVIWVAIADVAAWVRPGSALDAEARKRGNSTYFPDRVVPMLPEPLSADLCALSGGVERACIAARLTISSAGRLVAHRFTRGIMRSRAALEYGAVQAAVDGRVTDQTAPLVEGVLKPLYAAHAALVRARAARQPLDLDLPERQIVLDDAGQVVSVAFRDRLDAHRLIEEFMILANVAAAETLIARRMPAIFRVHEEPDPERIESLRDLAHESGFTLAKSEAIGTGQLNRLLHQAEGSDQAELINMSVLRSMAQAYYSTQNLGHFGLALRNYVHFTSPIRRYADLMIHRALISAHGWGNDGLSPDDRATLDETAQAISDTERRSMAAERDTTDRYLAAYLSERAGAEFAGRISGIQSFGLFVKLDETGADALVPVRSLGDEYFRFDKDAQSLTGADSGRVLRAGQRVTVKLAEITPISGGITAELLMLDGQPFARKPSRGRRGAPARRGETLAKGRAAARAKADRRRK
ncbi:MAG: ribonuclease R [Rubellimicrobium sp.]|nr:ribonuclease R [Rubellimicrobium sp.]